MRHKNFEDLDSGIRDIFARADAGEHPSSEALASYARDQLAEAEAERVQAHLGLCRECTAAVLALDFTSLEATADSPPDAEVAAEIEAIVASVDSRRGEGWHRALLAAAAVLAVACLSLAWLVVELRRQVGELEVALSGTSGLTASAEQVDMPLTGVPIVDLYPGSVARGEAAAAQPVPWPADAALVTLILTPPSGVSHDAYGLRVLDPGGVELWRGPARPGAAGTFVLMLPRRFAEAGVDRIELHGVDGESERLLQTYRVRFER